MSSSTSSFRTELKVLAAVALVMLGVELFMRKVESALSIDIKHIRSAPEIAESMGGDDQFDVLFLGNSLTRFGIDAETVRVRLEDAGIASPNVRLYHPDGTGVTEWTYAFRRYFAETDKLPDAIVIGTARTHLNDARTFPVKVGPYFCSVSDVPRFLREETDSLEDASRFLLSRVSTAYSGRYRVRPRLFTAIVPHYQEILRLLTTHRNDDLDQTDEKDVPDFTQRNLAALLSALESGKVHTSVLAIPMPEAYSLSPDITNTLEAFGVTLVDARSLPGITAGNFPDEYHLDADGARLVSEFVADKLGPGWKEIER